MKQNALNRALLLFVTVVMVILIFLVNVSSDDTFTSGFFIYTVTNGEATLVSYDHRGTGTIVIPETLGGYPVTAIANGAFTRADGMTGVIIPDSVVTIGNNAFSSCDSLGKVTLGKGVQSIGTDAFQYCFNLSEVHITDLVDWCNIDFANGNSNPLKNSAALYLNGNLVSDFVVPESITSIGNYLFYAYDYIKTVTFHDNVTDIGEGAFYYCRGLKSIEFPDSVTSIGALAFGYGRSLKTVTIPEGVTSVGESAFFGCDALSAIEVEEGNDFYKSVDGVLFTKDGSVLMQYPCMKPDTVYTVPDGVKSIDPNAFAVCNALTEVIISDSVTDIGVKSFANCQLIKNVVVGNGVKVIGESAFSECISLESITIGSSVSSINGLAFYLCQNLRDIYISDVAAWCNIEFLGSLSNPLYYADNLYIDGELAGSVDIPQGATRIVDSAFQYCTSITSVTVPDTVTYIGQNAFSYCTNLVEVSIPDSVTYIGPNAFKETALYLDSGNWEDGLLYIGNHLIKAKMTLWEHFEHYYDDVIIKDGTVTIAGNTFADCGYFHAIIIPASVTSIGDRAFYNCQVVDDIYYGGSEDDFSKISIGADNGRLFSQYIRFHYDAPDPATHYEIVGVREPTCTTAGFTYSVCSCPFKHSKQEDSAPATGHDIIKHDGKTPTCIETGYAAYETCSMCNYTTYKDLPRTGHSITEHDGKAPTCTEVGWLSYKTCSTCDYTNYAELRAYGHTYEKGVCKYCGDMESGTIFGDVTGDKTVNLTDVSAILKHIAKWDIEMNTNAADVTGDGKVNLMDVSLIMKYIAKWDVVLGK